MKTLNITDIQAPISDEIGVFEKKFREYVRSNVFLLDKIMNYIVKRKGKQMRPMFVFLVSKLCGGITDATHRGAALIELLHTATLVHDDVVDNSNYRRGFFSINALWKNKIAVLVGDYLLSRGLLLSVDNGDFELLKIVSNAVKEMSEGELLQMEKSRFLDIDEEVYFKIIRQKTAVLISACCAVGARSAGADDATTKLMADFGDKIGIAFQIKDDLFDYGGDESIGKPVGIDIKEKKMTLPLIHALKVCSSSDKKHILNIVKNKSEDAEKVQEVIAFVKEKGGLRYAESVMNRYYEEAMAMLAGFEESPSKTSLGQLVAFTISRKK